MKIIKWFVLLLLFSQSFLFSEEIDVSMLPKLLGSNNVGKEFYFTFIPIASSIPESDLKLYISSNIRTKVIVEVVEKGYEKIKYTVPNDIIEYTLAPSIGQCYRISGYEPPEPDQVCRGVGVHIISDDPIICYGVSRYYGSSDGFLVIPVNMLGKEYIVASYADPTANISQWFPSYTGITAAYDKTKVWFTMGGTDSSKTAGGLCPGDSSKWNMNKGDVLLIASKGSHADLSGSKVTANKPVSVISGNACAYVPTNCGCCDVLEEMEIPTQAWGQTYHVSPIIGRKKNSIIKIFAKEDKTVIYKDYEQIGIIEKGGGVEGIGYIHMRADSSEPRPVVITGNKPISVTQYNTGQQDDGVASDPFQMALLPIEQYQKEITFNTPGIRGGYGFPKNYINVCYETDSSGNLPDDLEIAFYNYKDSIFDWYKLRDKLGAKGQPFANYEFGKQYSSATYKLPEDGVYKIKADKPFQAYSYGFSSYDSYGHPASVSLKRLDIIDTLPPKPEWLIDCAGNVNADTVFVKDKPDDIANRSNIAMITMHSDLSYNYKLYYDDFMPCQDTAVAWQLEIIDNSEDARAVVTFADCVGNDTTLIIEFYANKLRIIPKEINLERHNIGQKSEQLLYVFNASGTTASELKYMNLKLKDLNGTPQGFTLWDSTGKEPLPTEFNTPIVIQPLDSMPFMVKFEATEYGEFWDSVGIGDSCNFWYKSIVEANVGIPIIDVSDWHFPPTMVGSPAYGNFTIKNNGSVSLVITDYYGPFITGLVSRVKIYNSADLEGKGITPTSPLILKPDESVAFQVLFIPDEEKSYPDSIVFTSNTIKADSLNKGNPIDSVCLFDGIGIRSEVQINGYNWGRKRISRLMFPIPPYPVEINSINPDSAIKIYNGSNSPVTITNLKNTTTQGDINAFMLNRADLLTTLQPGETKVVPVEFQPTTIGLHLLTLEYTTNPTIPNLTTTLQGIGIIPKIETSDVDFGATIVSDFINPNTRQVKLRNLSIEEWQYGDSVTITDFQDGNINPEIVTNWDSFLEPFRYDKDPIAIQFPIILQPGEEFIFDAEFVAKGKGLFKGYLSTVSDAEIDVTSEWTGYDSEYIYVKDIDENINFIIYPNPVNDELIINSADNFSGIEVFDYLAREQICSAKNNGNERIIDTSNLPNGIYLLKISIGNDFVFRKFIIQR